MRQLRVDMSSFESRRGRSRLWHGPVTGVIAVLSTHRALAALLVAGLAVRLLLLGQTATTPLRIVDEQHYAELAANLAHGRGFAWDSGALTSLRPPLYPFFVATVWRLIGSDSLPAVRTVQIFLALLTSVLAYVLGQRLFDRRAGLVAAAIVCFYPSLLYSGVLLLTETLFTSLLMLLVIQYAWLIQRPG